jgi:mevalonate pyrophosphate decarboxylase
MTSPDANRSDLDAAAERIRQLNERILESARNTGLSSLDVYEKTLKSIADMQQAVGQASSSQSFSAIAAAPANFTREMAEAYASAGREML